MLGDRDLEWPGCFNARDLGGLPAAGARRTRWGAIVRADSLAGLSETGWRALLDHGVRTILDLRNEDERGEDASPRPAGLCTRGLPLDNIEARDFWEDSWEDGPQFGTPLYYRAHILRFPERSAGVLSAIARADPGGVAVHCTAGRDRTGQIAMLALALAGVDSETIAADYELSRVRISAMYTARGEPDEGAASAAFLREHGTTAAEVIATTLSSIDVEGRLRAGGLTDQDVTALRERLLEPVPTR